ncbi:putative disease resistance protein At5g05400 [Vigna radiata var. radiata]|uniref:Disease resistance protein At5g05400 n=1 Tax=Vigna radiata var. radiata TaxID=3916 RepID=A0A3Q0EZU3_VIGRR|nr:putative disease resistance protein At5g05400 [Vigna radiata var. radiata]
MDPIVSTATESALNITASVVKRQVGYFFNYKDKIRELESYIEKLEHNKERLQHQVDNALRNAEEIEKDVHHCLTLMDDKIKEYKSYINDECHAKTICSFGFFPNNFRLRYQLGRKATKMVKEIIGDELWKTSFDNVSYQEFPSIDATFSNNGYESFGSRTKTMEMIMKALQDSTVGLIGVYGPGGVGKTTLVKEIAKKAREKKLFKIVIIANITGNPDFKNIQEQIAGMLGMKLEGESEIARVDRIRKRLKNEKESTLIILDDLWARLDFNKLGIPCNDDASQQEVNDMSDFGSNNDPSDFGYNKTEIKELSKVDLDKMKKEKLSNDYRRGKILLISRNKQVLCNEMDVQQSSIFSVGVLDEKESETLLKKVVGVKNSEFDKNATEIAKWSAGFPIALVSIGRTLKNKSLSTWEDVCQQIKRQNFTSEWGFTDFSIKLSYDHLKNEELKSIFLHCARMGNDALIMDLVKFCVGLNLLPGVHTITNARKRVKEIIQELEESSLLVKSYSIDRFNMHDIVRDVALSILSKEKHVLFMKNAVLDEWPHENDFERLNSYKIVIGEFNLLNLLTVGEFRVPDKYEEVKFLAINLKEGIDIHSEKWIKMLFKTVERLNS